MINNQQSTANNVDTQPHLPKIQIPFLYRSFRSRKTNCLLILVCLFAAPISLCGLSLVAYLLFPPAHTDILIMGIDGRDSEGFMARSDSIMLMGVSPAKLQTSLLSIPRDLFIDVPDYGLQRINTVNMLGEQTETGYGPILLGASIEQGFGISIERYMRLDFAGFVDLIDAVGGVTIEVERLIVDDSYPTSNGGVTSVRFEPGAQHMDGEQALIYARTRHADDDYQRAGRQQQVVSALMGKLVNPLNWPSVVNVLNRSLDTNMNLWDMATLAPPIVFSTGNYDQLVIDREYITATSDGFATPNYTLIAPWTAERFE